MRAASIGQRGLPLGRAPLPAHSTPPFGDPPMTHSTTLPRRHLLALVYEHLADRVRCAPGLEDTAAAFGLSAATFKRRLAACGTHFQAELDQVRLHTALRLMHGRGLDNDAIGRFLGIEDPANFRRSMKRWAGLTPAQLRLGLD
eukprot:gene47822-biopygen38786